MSTKIQRLLDFLPYLMAVTSAAVSRRIANQYEAASGLRIFAKSGWRPAT